MNRGHGDVGMEMVYFNCKHAEMFSLSAERMTAAVNKPMGGARVPDAFGYPFIMKKEGPHMSWAACKRVSRPVGGLSERPGLTGE